MNVHVHIERLVAHDAALSRREREALGPAIERELARLNGRAGEIARPVDPGHPLAARIAGAIHRQVTAATDPAGRAR